SPPQQMPPRKPQVLQMPPLQARLALLQPVPPQQGWLTLPHWQVPLAQTVPLGQTLPQLPQLALLLFRSTQDPEQPVWPLPQHSPAVQWVVTEQECPQEPQFASSLARIAQ